MRKVRENIIASKGNYPVFAEGSAVFSAPVVQGGGYTINVLPGQWVFYDAEAGSEAVGLGPGVTAATVNKLTIAVGRDLNGNGASDALLKPFGDSLSPWGIYSAKAKCPACAIPGIQDALFRCVQAGDSYTLHVQTFDETTDNQYPFNVPAIYTYTVKVEDLNCDGCTEAEVTDQVVCAFIDQINGVANPSPVNAFGLKRRSGDVSKSFSASRLWPNSIDFCLTASSTACDTCKHIQGIKGIRIDSSDHVFTNTLDPANPTLTLDAQVQHIINQINVILDGSGTAIKVAPVGNCCDVRIQINSCLTVNNLIGHDDAVVADCGTSTPLAAIARDITCPTCPAGAAITDVYAGIRLYHNIPQPVCDDCYPPNPPQGWLSGEIKVFGGKGFDSSSFRSREIQAATVPENLGYEWQWREYVQDTGGSGRDFEPYHDSYGPIGLPNGTERPNQTTVDCRANYCSYILEHEIPNENNSVSPAKRYARGRTVFLVPSLDTVTIAEFEAIINPFLASTTCPNKAALTCACSEEDPEVV